MKIRMTSRWHAPVALVVGLLVGLASPSVKADSIVITNNSFENSTGYWALFVAPSSWAANNGVTTGCTMNAQVVTGLSLKTTGLDGANVLSLNLDVGQDLGASGTAWVSTKSLGKYQPNTVYTLTVAEATLNNNSTRSTTIALAAQKGIPDSGSSPANAVASTSMNFTNLSSNFTNVIVLLNTRRNPAVVGQDIAALLEQNAVQSQYGNAVFFDNVRLNTAPAPIP